MDSKKPLYKSKTFWALGLFLLYSALGFFAVPYYLEKKINLISSNELNSTTEVGSVSFNPFSFTTQIKNLKLTDTDSKTWFSADKLLINIGLFKSIFSQTTISEITINKPNYLLLLENNKNKTRLKYPVLNITESQETDLFKIDIDKINIHDGALSYRDSTTDNLVEITFKEVGFKHLDFTTDDKHSTFDLSLTTEQNDNMEFMGTFNFAQLSSTGNWSLNHFSTETVFKFITDSQQQFFGFKNQTGIINAKGEYIFNAHKQENLDLIIKTLKLENFSTATINPNHPSVIIPNLELKQAHIDLQKKQLTISEVGIENTEIIASFSDTNTLIWADNINQSKTDHPGAPSGNSWQYQIDGINSNNTSIILNKTKNNESFKNTLKITHAEITNLTSSKQQDTVIKLTIVPDISGALDLLATVQVEPLTIKSVFTAKDINLVSAQAWIPNDIKMKIEKGLLSLHQTFTMENDEYQSTGWIKFSNLNLLDENNQTFLKVAELELAENAIDSSNKTITLNNIKLDKAEGNLVVSDDKTLNINGIISDQQEKEKIKEKIKDTKNDWIINIQQIELNDSQTHFTDRSIKPHYQSKLTKINGTIKGLSSANTSKADINLKGTLDTYAQLNVLGKINPLSEKAYTDLAININNLDLQNFSTYSTKFIGFPINRGKADFKLNYKLNQSLLKGINDLTFKQLQLGNKIQSKDAVNLPLKLAISLLTNNKGIMTINLPVSGRIDDPSFSYGGLVFKAFFKLITGIVASPFKLLGKLIPGGADLDMSGIQFQAGTINLVEGEEEKLKAMQSILENRATLILELSSTINSIEDAKALNIRLLLETMQLTNKPDLSDISSIKTLKNNYKKLLDLEQWQALEANATKEGVLNHLQLATNAWQNLLTTFVQETHNELELIGKQRAQRIQTMLIEDYKIPEKRIFLKPTEISDQLSPQVKFGVAN